MKRSSDYVEEEVAVQKRSAEELIYQSKIPNPSTDPESEDDRETRYHRFEAAFMEKYYDALREPRKPIFKLSEEIRSLSSEWQNPKDMENLMRMCCEIEELKRSRRP